jgi:cyanophycinase
MRTLLESDAARRALACLAAWVALATPPGVAADAPPPSQAALPGSTVPAAATPGAVVAIGGGLRNDNHAVWSRLVSLAGGPGARFVVLPTASSDPVAAGAEAVAALAAHGAEAEALPVSPRAGGVDPAQAVRDPELVARIRAARGVYFTGGAQEYIVDALQPGGEATPMLEAIREVLARGGAVAGTSAGAAVMSAVMFRDPPVVATVMKGSLRPGLDVDRGLGFVGPTLFVDQHFLRRGRLGRALPLMQSRGIEVGIGIEEDTAAVVRGDEIEVIGPGGVLFVDLGEATIDPGRGAFNIAGVRLTYLADGDRFDVRTRVLTPAPDKLKGQRIEPAASGFRPYYPDTPFLLDVLGEGAVLKAMTYMVDGPAATVRGLAYDAGPDAAAPRDLGFEFRFSRTRDTVGWFASVNDVESYTVANVRLDVVPVRVAAPLYRDWPKRAR